MFLEQAAAQSSSLGLSVGLASRNADMILDACRATPSLFLWVCVPVQGGSTPPRTRTKRRCSSTWLTMPHWPFAWMPRRGSITRAASLSTGEIRSGRASRPGVSSRAWLTTANLIPIFTAAARNLTTASWRRALGRLTALHTGPSATRGVRMAGGMGNTSDQNGLLRSLARSALAHALVNQAARAATLQLTFFPRSQRLGRKRLHSRRAQQEYVVLYEGWERKTPFCCADDTFIPVSIAA